MNDSCENCGNFVLADEYSGDLVCPACGLVQGRLILPIAESSLQSESGGVMLDRLGDSYSVLDEGSFPVDAAGYAQAPFALASIEASLKSSSQKAMEKLIGYMTSMVTRSNLQGDEGLLNTCRQILIECYSRGFKPAKSRPDRLYCATVVFMACRLAQHDLSFKDAAATLGVAKIPLARVFKQMQQRLGRNVSFDVHAMLHTLCVRTCQTLALPTLRAQFFAQLAQEIFALKRRSSQLHVVCAVAFNIGVPYLSLDFSRSEEEICRALDISLAAMLLLQKEVQALVDRPLELKSRLQNE